MAEEKQDKERDVERAGGRREFTEENRGERTSGVDNNQGQRAATQTGSSGTIDQGGKFADPVEERGAGLRTAGGKPGRRTSHEAEGPDED